MYDVYINDFYYENDVLKQTKVESNIPKLFFGGASWFPDNKRLYYCTHNEETQNFDKVWVQDIETKESKLIFQEKDLVFSVHCSISEKDNQLII